MGGLIYFALKNIVCTMEVAFMLICILLVERYVFLIPSMDKKKLPWFYGISFATVIIANFINSNLAMVLIHIVGMLNIALVRKKWHKLEVLFILPIAGIVNGLVIPLLIVPEVLSNWGFHKVLIFRGFFYSIIYPLLLIFYFKGKKFRANIEKEKNNRRLQYWEKILLCIVGFVMVFYSKTLSSIPTDPNLDPFYLKQFTLQTILNGGLSFILTISVIILILQGNKRSYYYEETLKSQKIEAEKERALAASEAKSVFLSNMSHEIRTPMNAIVGMTEIVLREEHSPKVREYLGNIKNSGAALLTIINDILDFSKIESGKMEIVETEYETLSMFNDLSMIFLNRIGDKPVELIYDIDKDIPTRLCGDDNRIRQVIINLMNNAIKFTESGYVKLAVRMEKSNDSEAVMHVSVEDSGIGIKDCDMDKLFGSFTQVDTKKNRDKEGTGLGLAISKQLVELMNGKIGVSSEYGKGSKFYFSVPQRIVNEQPATQLKEGINKTIGIKIGSDILKEQVIQLARTFNVKCVDYSVEPDVAVDYLITDNADFVTTKQESTKICVMHNPMTENIAKSGITVINKPLYSLNFCQLLNNEEMVLFNANNDRFNFTAPDARVLIVDDNEMNLKVAKGLLEPFSMYIDTACNGKEAVKMVSDSHYDIVFMDHMMPIMDGIEATKAIRAMGEEYYNLPIIALSANATQEAKEMFKNEGLNDFVAKPIKLKEICRSIINWLPNDLIHLGNEPKVPEATIQNQEEEFIIEGLDVAEGIKNCGSKKLFMELLGDFYKLIDPKSIKLEKCLADNMIRDYTIEVHALKNTARMIGAMELSDLFYQMEKLGNEENVEEITKRNPEVIDLYRSYKEILKDYAASVTDKKTVSNEIIKRELMCLHDAMDSFDLDEADRAMKEIESFSLPIKLQSMAEELSAYVADVAMEDVIRLTEAMCDELQNCEEDKRSFILMVDDDSINNKAVASMLADEYRIMTLEFGEQLFDTLKNEVPELILLDVHMPGMDGHEIISVLKKNPDYMDIPVIFLTSDEDEKTEMQGFSEGAIDFLKKPMQKGVAVHRIRRILELSYLQKNLKEEVVKQTEVAEKRRESVERMSLQMVQTLANTIDAKDSYTNGHSTRVAKYSVMIAKRMGYTDERLEQLQYAALLHDIGKIGIPNEIINKPSRLTDEEYEIIKTHPGIGGKILDEITEIPDIAIGARWHHERIDGRGYPDKLSGDNIPEIAKIIGVADAYDAMTSNRSYRGLMPQENVCAELIKGKGTQFDPYIADIMIDMIKEDVNYEMHE